MFAATENSYEGDLWNLYNGEHYKETVHVADRNSDVSSNVCPKEGMEWTVGEYLKGCNLGISNLWLPFCVDLEVQSIESIEF